jgi:hypothetical protein
VQLIYHHRLCRREQPGYFAAAADEQCLKRFRGDQQDACGLLKGAGFGAGRYVAMPRHHGQINVLANLGETARLIGDQGFQRPDIQQIKASGPQFGRQHLRDQRQESGLGFATCC